jgi:hypothetical protein
MRYLHPVGPHEVFVGSGTHVTRRDGEPFGPVEHWTIHELPDGAWLMRVDGDGREVDGRSELIEAWRSPDDEGGRIERFDVVASNRPDDVPRRVRATYETVGAQLSVGRSLGADERLADVLDLPAGTMMQPGAYAFVGGLLTGGAMSVAWRHGLGGLYAAELATVAVQAGESSELEVSGRVRAVREYRGGGVMGPSHPLLGEVRYWVDTYGMLVRCTAGEIEVTLERYAFRR